MSEEEIHQIRETFAHALGRLLPVETLLSHAQDDRSWPAALGDELAQLGWPAIALDGAVGGYDFDRRTRIELYGIAGAALLPAGHRMVASVVAPALAEQARRGTREAASALDELLAGTLLGSGAVLDTSMRQSGDRPVDLWGNRQSGISVIVHDGAVQVARIADNAELATVPSIERPGDRVRLTRRHLEEQTSWVIDDPAVARALTAEWQLACLAECVGVAAGQLQRTVQYAHQREQFGQPIASFQAVSHRLADMAARVEVGRSVLSHLAGAGDSETTRMLHAAAALVPQHAREVCEGAIQLHGATGFAWETGLQLGYRRVLQLQVVLGGARASMRAVGEDLIRSRRSTR